MKFDQLLDQSQSDAGTFDASPTRALHTVEALENVGQFRRGNAGACVSDCQFHTAIRAAQGHMNTSFEGKFQSVRE